MEQDVDARRPFSGLGNQCAAIGAWDPQVADQPIAPDRPGNLYKPADDDVDRGAHGLFEATAGSFVDTSLLKALPTTDRIFSTAFGRTVEDEAKTHRAIRIERMARR